MIETAQSENITLSKEGGKIGSEMEVVRGQLSNIVREVSKTAETADTYRNETEKSRQRLVELRREYLDEIRSRCDEKIEENELFLKGRPKISLCFHDAFERIEGSKLEKAREKVEKYHDRFKENLCDRCNKSIDEEWQKLAVHECAIGCADDGNGGDDNKTVLLGRLVPFEE